VNKYANAKHITQTSADYIQREDVGDGPCNALVEHCVGNLCTTSNNYCQCQLHSYGHSTNVQVG